MSTFNDLTGKTFGRWKVLSRAPNSKNRDTRWFCKCECGTEKIVRASHMTKGRTVSCGCFCLEVNSERLQGNKFGLIHGFSNHPLRAIRKSMIHRCYNKNNPFYKTYGARGIIVCDKWKNSLEDFIEWAISNGWKKGLSIDRIDNDKNYDPSNCHWITISENSSKNAKRAWKEGTGLATNRNKTSL